LGFYHFERQTSQRFHRFSSGQSVPQSWGATIATALVFLGPMTIFNQAIFSFPNTSTLMMVLILVNVIRIFQSGNCFDIRVALRLYPFQAAVTFCIICDSRLEGDGLVYAIVAAGLYVLFSMTIRFFLMASGTEKSSVRPWSIVPAVGTTLLLVSIFEQPTLAFPSFFFSGSQLWIVVILNVLATCLAVYTGGSPHVYGMLPHHEERPSESGTPLNIWPTIVVAGFVSGILSFYQIIVISPYQILAYLVAILCSEVAPLAMYHWMLARFYGSSVSTIYTPIDLDDGVAKTSDVEGGHGQLDSGTTDRPFYRNNLILSATFFWAIVLAFSLKDTFATAPASKPVYLDTVYQPTTDLDIVISMYREPMVELTKTIDLITSVKTVASRNARIYLYIKDQDADLDQMRASLSKYKLTITLLPNVGREGETYLSHILSQWDNLANHTMFLQAETHTPREILPRIRDYFYASTGMLSLSFMGNTCDCNSNLCTDRFWSDGSGLVQQTYLTANRLKECPTPDSKILLSYKGQFIASAARIRGVEKKVYADLQKLFVDENSYVHSKEYLSKAADLTGTKDQMSAPVFGFSMERLWSSLMQCDDMEVARRCPSLLSGWRTGGSRRDCQCLD